MIAGATACQDIIHQDVTRVFSAQSSSPLSREFYFEVTVLELAKTGGTAVGIAVNSIPHDQLPGLVEKTLGYHSDSGSVFCGNLQLLSLPLFGVGDVIGCGQVNNLLYFTLNGQVVGSVPCDFHEPRAVAALDCVGTLRVNLGDGAFQYPHSAAPMRILADIQHLQLQEQKKAPVELKVIAGKLEGAIRGRRFVRMERGGVRGVVQAPVTFAPSSSFYFEVYLATPQSEPPDVRIGVAEHESAEHPCMCSYKGAIHDRGGTTDLGMSPNTAVGCGSRGDGFIYFTLDGKRVASPVVAPVGVTLSPTIDIKYGARVQLLYNGGDEPFLYPESAGCQEMQPVGEHLLNLPDELLQDILVRCSESTVDVFPLVLTCKRFKELLMTASMKELWRSIAERKWHFVNQTVSVSDWFGYTKRRSRASLAYKLRHRGHDPHVILECSDDDHEWAFKCPMLLEDLGSNDFCGVCKRHVQRVYSAEDIQKAASKGQCVAYDPSFDPSQWLGEPVFRPRSPRSPSPARTVNLDDFTYNG